jgi:hypothetical protein
VSCGLVAVSLRSRCGLVAVRLYLQIQCGEIPEEPRMNIFNCKIGENGKSTEIIRKRIK